ncbi:MAG TPA: beta-galactosidase GalB, partial [Pontiella sp.]
YRGDKAELEPYTVYRGEMIPSQLTQKISSLILKQGHQVVIGVEEDGIGLSKVLIANKRDVRIPLLSKEFNDSIQFIRVLPWKNVMKKGFGGTKRAVEVDSAWYYNWTPTPSAEQKIPFTPMATNYLLWPEPLENLEQLQGVQDILGFNEPNEEGKPFREQKKAVLGLKKLMPLGLRISSPNLREEGPRRWLPEFWEIAREEQLRIDFIGVHWYDWGGQWPDKTPDAKASDIFKRFKKYLSMVHETYGLPLWVTEFNANVGRPTETQLEFLELALPYLEECPYVERYAFFQPNSRTGEFWVDRNDPNSPLTELGRFWAEFESTPAMTAEVYLGKNNLCEDEVEESDSLRARSSFNQGWSFARFGTMPGGNRKPEPAGIAQPDFDDCDWKRLDLPHDWAIEGPFDIELPGSTGKLPWKGIGWYRKTFTLPESDKGCRIFLDLDGAMANAEIYLNGEKVGGRPYGYISFRTELTDHLRFDQSNTLAVRLDTEKWGSRWYPGAGIYRNTWLVKTAPVHITHHGVHVITPDISRDQATAELNITVGNSSNEKVEAQVKSFIYEYGTDAKCGKQVAETDAVSVTLSAGEQDAVSLLSVVASPRLWDIRDPHRYLARVEVRINDRLVDRYDQPFGFRSLEFTSRNGFKLNGRRVEIKGVCMHHDLGPLGAAFNVRAAERQLEIMKEMGVNAIRTSHNQPAPEILELCDRMGILVQVETFDCWRSGKKEHDYGDLFDEWHERDLASIMMMARNHPSVFMWCLGNEVKEQQTPEGIQILKRLREIARRYDASRPVTVGVSAVNPAFSGFQKEVDAFGYNYRLMGYEPYFKHTENIDLPLHGSETASCISSRGEYYFPVPADLKNMQSAGVPQLLISSWAKDKNGTEFGTGKNFQMSSYDIAAPFWGCTPDYQFMMLDRFPGVLGEFVWTGFDYLGEPTPYNKDLTNMLNEPDPVKRDAVRKQIEELGGAQFPSRSSFFGMVDLCGFKKDRFYLYQSRWRPDLPMAHILPHWNWPDRGGKITPVHVYTSGDEAELFLNGKSLGRRKKGEYEYRLIWNDVNYEPGELKVVAYKNGKLWAEDRMVTAGEASIIDLKADRNVIAADGYDLSFVTVRISDEQGRLVPKADHLIQFTIEGPGEIVAVGNGNANSHEPFQAQQRKAYNGLCLIIIKSKTDTPGEIQLVASGEGLQEAVLALKSRRR